MASSPVFRTMFRSGFKESETKRVNLKGKSVEQVLNMLDYMYPEKTQILTGKHPTLNYFIIKLAIRENESFTHLLLARVFPRIVSFHFARICLLMS